jgi:GrpB-like predicted nucleotidyltransferase (UPF0157 family)
MLGEAAEGAKDRRPEVLVAEADVARAVAGLATLGYEHRGNLGIPEREAFRRPPGSPRHNLYVCPVHSRALANHLAVRDRLRADPVARRAYGELKQRLAREFADDIDGYVQAKTGFLVALLRESGFPERELAAIEALNRRPDAEEAPPSPSR